MPASSNFVVISAYSATGADCTGTGSQAIKAARLAKVIVLHNDPRREKQGGWIILAGVIMILFAAVAGWRQL